MKTTEKVINGKRYIVAHIRSIALYPQEIGKLKVDPLEVEAIIVRHVAHKDPFDLFGDFLKILLILILLIYSVLLSLVNHKNYS